VPALPLTCMVWPVLMIFVTGPTFVTAGIASSRATIAPCERRPPRSVTAAAGLEFYFFKLAGLSVVRHIRGEGGYCYVAFFNGRGVGWRAVHDVVVAYKLEEGLSLLVCLLHVAFVESRAGLGDNADAFGRTIGGC